MEIVQGLSAALIDGFTLVALITLLHLLNPSLTSRPHPLYTELQPLLFLMKEGTTVDNTSFGECKILKGGLIKASSQEKTAGLVRFTIFIQPISERQSSLSILPLESSCYLYPTCFCSLFLILSTQTSPQNGCLLRNYSFQSSDLDSRTESPLGSFSPSFRVRSCQCIAQGRPILRHCRFKDVLVPGSHWLGYRNTLASARTWKWENHCHVQCL